MPEIEETTTITPPATNQHEHLSQQQQQQQQEEEKQDAAVVVTGEEESPSSSSSSPSNSQTHHIVVVEEEEEEDDDEILFVAIPSKKKQRMLKIIQDEDQGEYLDRDLYQRMLPQDQHQHHQQQADLGQEHQGQHQNQDLDEMNGNRKKTSSQHDHHQHHHHGRNSIIDHVNIDHVNNDDNDYDDDDDDDEILFVTTKPISATSSSSSKSYMTDNSNIGIRSRWLTVLFSREEQQQERWEILLLVLMLLLITAAGSVKFVLSRTRRTPKEGKQQQRILEMEKKTTRTKNSKKAIPEISATTPADFSSISETSAMKRSYESATSEKQSRKGETMETTALKMRKTSHLLSTPSSSLPPPLTDESSEIDQTLMVESSNENLELESVSASASLSPQSVVNGEEDGILLPHQTQKLTIQQSHQHQQDHQQQQQLSKKRMAKQLVKDIKMVQEVLEEHNLDPSLAPNLAMSLQTSHHIVDAQNKLEYKRTIIDVHQRQLDRQLSEKQHVETLRAAKYDPDWRHKLMGIATGDVGMKSAITQQNGGGGGRFATTTYLTSRISSTWWNVFWVQQLCRGLIPYIIQQYGPINYDHIQNSGKFNNDLIFGTTTSYESARILGGIIQNLMWAVLSQVCRCDDGGQQYQLSRVSVVESNSSSEGYTSLLDVFLTWAKPSFASPDGDSSSYSWIVLNSAKRVFFSSVVPVVEGCTCYGSCVLSISTLILASTLIHQGFRIVSAPQTCHHAVNLLTLVAIWGPDQIIKSLLSSILFLTGRDTPVDQIMTDETDNLFWREVADLFTLMILIFVPVWEWQATRRVYHHTESQIDQATTADFDAKFKFGRYRLEQWVTHTQLIRFVIFSVYSSVILWSVFG